MILRVALYELVTHHRQPKENLLGYIFWDGKKLTPKPAKPEYATFLSYVMHNPASDGESIIHAEHDPEGWIQALPDSYRGSYLWAGDVETVASPMR